MKQYKNDRNIKAVVIHCTAGSPNQEVKDILLYWENIKGWKNAGYHYLVDIYGKIHQIMDEKEISNGVKGHNSQLINIAWIGGYDKHTNSYVDNRTDIQKIALLELARTLMRKYNVKVIGHRDLSPDKNGDGEISPDEWLKECPLFDVKKEI